MEILNYQMKKDIQKRKMKMKKLQLKKYKQIKLKKKMIFYIVVK